MIAVLFYHLCELLVVSSIIIILVLLLSPFLIKRYGVKWRKYVWVLLGILMLFPYRIFDLIRFVKIPRIPINIFQAEWTKGYQVILCIWLIGAFIAFRIQRIRLKRTENRILETAEEAESATLKEVLENVKKESGIEEEVFVYFSEKVHTPILIGVIQPVIVLPDSYRDREDLNDVFHQQMGHLKALDAWYRTFMQVILSLYWFHPLIYVMVFQSSHDLDVIQKNREKKKGYILIPLFVVLFLMLHACFTFGDGNVRTVSGKIQGLANDQEDFNNNEETENATEEKVKYSDDGVHPDNGKIPDKDLIKKTQTALFKSMSSQNADKVKKMIRAQHHLIESTLVYRIDGYKNQSSLAWRNFDPDVKQESNRQKVDTDRSGYDDINALKQVKEIVNDPVFTENIDQAISVMEHAIKTHDIEDLYHYHQILHDLDYWLINYPTSDFKIAPPDWHGVYVYFDIIKYE